MLIDSHCHLQFKSFDDNRDAVISRSIEKGLIMNTIGTQMETSKKAVELAEQYEQVYATVGLHPIQHHKVKVNEESTSFVARGEDFDTAYYESLIQSSDKVIAIGETGLDAFHIPKDQSIDEIFDAQWSLFEKHVELAGKYNLPIVIHVRDAHDEMIKRLRGRQQPHPNPPLTRGGNLRAVVHCFTGTWEQASAYLDLGFYLGFTGVVTFPPKKNNPMSQEDLLDVLDKIPLDRMLVETDAPFLAPQAYRGKQCEPWMTEEVVKFIAERRGVSVDELREQTVGNTLDLFKKISL